MEPSRDEPEEQTQSPAERIAALRVRPGLGVNVHL